MGSEIRILTGVIVRGVNIAGKVYLTKNKKLVIKDVMLSEGSPHLPIVGGRRTSEVQEDLVPEDMDRWIPLPVGDLLPSLEEGILQGEPSEDLRGGGPPELEKEDPKRKRRGRKRKKEDVEDEV